MTLPLEQLPDGYDVMADDYNLLVRVVNLLAAQGVNLGGSDGTLALSANIDGGDEWLTPGPGGNSTINFNVTFDAVPAITLNAGIGQPNVVCTIDNDNFTVDHVGVHFQNANTGNPVTTGQVHVNWIAVAR